MATVAVKTHIANWFEIPAKDLDRAGTFYEKVFAVKLSLEDRDGMKLSMFLFTQNAPGAPDALVQGESYEPSHAGSSVYFIPEALHRINANGGKTLIPKTAIGQYGFIARYEDPEGNRLASFNEVSEGESARTRARIERSSAPSGRFSSFSFLGRRAHVRKRSGLSKRLFLRRAPDDS